MGLFNRKKEDSTANASLDVPHHTFAKSEATTAVPSQNASDTESLEKSRDGDTTVLDEKEPHETNKSINTTTTDNHSAIPSEGAEPTSETETKSEIQTKLERTKSHTSVITVPGAEEGDEITYPSGVKLALITLALCLAVFLVALDNTIIATAIPKITDHFKSLGDVGWYGSSYLLTTCALQLFFGKLYTFYSIKTVFLVSIFIFEVGSAVCGGAPTSAALIVGRAIAGVGSAGIFSGALIIIA